MPYTHVICAIIASTAWLAPQKMLPGSALFNFAISNDLEMLWSRYADTLIAFMQMFALNQQFYSCSPMTAFVGSFLKAWCQMRSNLLFVHVCGLTKPFIYWIAKAILSLVLGAVWGGLMISKAKKTFQLIVTPLIITWARHWILVRSVNHSCSGFTISPHTIGTRQGNIHLMTILLMMNQSYSFWLQKVHLACSTSSI